MPAQSDDVDARSPVVFRTYSSQLQAEIVANMLRNSGVEVTLSSDDAGGTYPNFRAAHGVRLLIRREDEARAAEIVSQVVELQDDDESPSDS